MWEATSRKVRNETPILTAEQMLSLAHGNTNNDIHDVDEMVEGTQATLMFVDLYLCPREVL